MNFLENAVFHAKGMTELKLSVSLAGDKAVFRLPTTGVAFRRVSAFRIIFLPDAIKSLQHR